MDGWMDEVVHNNSDGNEDGTNGSQDENEWTGTESWND
jgi:hypothetical protein